MNRRLLVGTIGLLALVPATGLLAIIGGPAVAGGIARLISVAVNGWPHPVFTATIVLELVIVPLVIWWHARVIPVGGGRVPAPQQKGAAT